MRFEPGRVIVLTTFFAAFLVTLGLLAAAGLAFDPTLSSQDLAVEDATFPSPSVSDAPSPVPSIPAHAANPSPTTLPSGRVGQRQVSLGIALTVVSVKRMASANGLPLDSPGKVLIVADVLIENVSRDEAAPYNLLYFRLQDSNGYTFSPGVYSVDPELHSGRLPKGDKVRGNVVYEVPAASNGLVLSYESLALFQGNAAIRVNLGQ